MAAQDKSTLKVEILSAIELTIRGRQKFKGNVQKCSLTDISRWWEKCHPKTKFKSSAGCSLKKFLEDCGINKVDGNGIIEVVADQLQQLLVRAKAEQSACKQVSPSIANSVKQPNTNVDPKPAKDPAFFPKPKHDPGR